MRLSVLFLFLAVLGHAIAGPTPPELETVLKTFRTEGAKGWAYTQTTTSGERSRVERFNPLGRESVRWTLLMENGQAPSADETRKYTEQKLRRTSNETPPNVKDQIRPGTCEILEESPERGVYQFQLKPGGEDDHSAEFMTVTFTLHRPTGTIEKVELASIGAFSPVLLVNIEDARTVMSYSLPENDRPSLLQEVSVRVRGRAMWVKSLDQDMIVSYSDYEYVGKR